VDGTLIAVAGAGVVGGLVALGRGFVAYRMSLALADTTPSRIASAAVGELLVTGVAEPAALSLVSPLQSAACLYYRSTIDEDGGDRTTNRMIEERAVGFTVRDASGAIRVFPRDARFDVPTRFSASTGILGDEPPGLRLRTGPAYGALPDRDAQVAALLTVRRSTTDDAFTTLAGGGSGFAGLAGATRRARRFTEARIEPGDVVTVIGRALPFDQLADPEFADSMIGSDPLLADPEIAADLAAARANGELEMDPAEAWGNAAIPGFGIGRPVREPELEVGVSRVALADPATADRFERTFAIAADDLVLATSDEVPLVISLGPPSVAAGRQTSAMLVGLLGAIVAIGAAMALALMLGGPS
jgi:hypothetical protein